MPESGVVLIETQRLELSLPPVDLAPAVLAYVERNREHLTPWEPPRAPDFYTEDYWRDRLLVDHEDFDAGRALRLVLRRRDDPDGEVIGLCNFNQIVRGAFLAATLGYSIDQRFAGQGMMREALAGAIGFLFDALGFHRVMANYLPENARSGRLLRRLGFVVEGYARDYLFINGAWRDHILTALTNPAPTIPVPPRPRPAAGSG